VSQLVMVFQVVLVSLLVYSVIVHQLEIHYKHQRPFPCGGEFEGFYCPGDFETLESYRIPTRKEVSEYA